MEKIKEFILLREVLRSRNCSWDGIPNWIRDKDDNGDIVFIRSSVYINLEKGKRIVGNLWDYLTISENGNISIQEEVKFIKIK